MPLEAVLDAFVKSEMRTLQDQRCELTAAELAVWVDCFEAEDTLPELPLEEVAPVAAIRASRSAAVVQVILVPAEFTRGRAAQLVMHCHTYVSRDPTSITRKHAHKTASARCQDEFPAHTLSEFVVDTGVFARIAG